MPARDKYDPTDQLRITNVFLKHHPQVREAIAVASTVISKVQFPINSFQDLADAMGSAETAVQFGGRSFTLAELECQVPSYYFPIANENDLIAKIGDLSKRLPSAKAPAPALIPATASMPSAAPPTMSLEEMQAAARRLGHGVSGAGGIKR